MYKQLAITSTNPRRYLRKFLDKHHKLQIFSSQLYLKYCYLTGFMHVLPDFLIIGFPKCGTTSLYEYIIQHPSVYSTAGKEIEFFSRLYSRGINWYKSQFPLKLQKFFVNELQGKNFVTGEATPMYVEHPISLQRIRKTIPNVKLIILLRNPVDRAFSHYNMNYQNGYEYHSFEEAIKKEKERIRGRYEKMINDINYYSWDYDLFGYLEHGIYYEKIKKWMKVFPKNQFEIIQSEEFLNNPSTTYHKVLNFLGLPKWEPEEYILFKKRTSKKDIIDNNLRKKLLDYYKPYNDKLFELLGTKFDWDF